MATDNNQEPPTDTISAEPTENATIIGNEESGTQEQIQHMLAETRRLNEILNSGPLDPNTDAYLLRRAVVDILAEEHALANEETRCMAETRAAFGSVDTEGNEREDDPGERQDVDQPLSEDKDPAEAEDHENEPERKPLDPIYLIIESISHTNEKPHYTCYVPGFYAAKPRLWRFPPASGFEYSYAFIAKTGAEEGKLEGICRHESDHVHFRFEQAFIVVLMKPMDSCVELVNWSIGGKRELAELKMNEKLGGYKADGGKLVSQNKSPYMQSDGLQHLFETNCWYVPKHETYQWLDFVTVPRSYEDTVAFQYPSTLKHGFLNYVTDQCDREVGCDCSSCFRLPPSYSATTSYRTHVP